MSPVTANLWKDRPVLVTGHTGFKGAWLSLWLARHGARVSGFALPPDTEPSLFGLALPSGDIDSRLGDIRQLEEVQAAVEAFRPSVVFHLAAQSLVRPSYRDPVGTYATNVMGTVHLLEAVRRVGSAEAVVVVTSDKCYENREWDWPYRENEAMGGHDPYSSSKGCAELVASAYRSSFFKGDKGGRCRIATARAGNVIGGGDWSEDRLIPDIVRAMVRGLSAEIRNPGAIRPWQHVLEPLSGYIRLAECLLSPEGDRCAEGWNFGPAEADCRPVSDVADRLVRGWGGAARWHLSEARHPHEAASLKVDSSKSLGRLGWRRRVPLGAALDWTVEWYRAQAGGADAYALTMDQIERYDGLEPALP